MVNSLVYCSQFYIVSREKDVTNFCELKQFRTTFSNSFIVAFRKWHAEETRIKSSRCDRSSVLSRHLLEGTPHKWQSIQFIPKCTSPTCKQCFHNLVVSGEANIPSAKSIVWNFWTAGAQIPVGSMSPPQAFLSLSAFGLDFRLLHSPLSA